jgi:hypothetical protein
MPSQALPKAFADRWFLSFALLAWVLSGVTLLRAQNACQTPDSSGDYALIGSITCPTGGLAGSTTACYQIRVQNCKFQGTVNPKIDLLVEVKVSTPPGTSKGTVVFLTGQGGNAYYDTDFRYGTHMVYALYNNQFTIVQFNFDNGLTSPNAGWMQGPPAPSSDHFGPRTLACRVAAAMKWVNDQHLAASTPLCATGNSGGSGAIGYMLAHYGLGLVDAQKPLLSMVVPSSGPPFARVDNGCSNAPPTISVGACSGLSAKAISESFGAEGTSLLDPSYSNAYCSTCIADDPNCQFNTWEDRWRDDSVNSDDAGTSWCTSYGNTYVQALYGYMDITAAFPLGLEWSTHISSANPNPNLDCIPDAPHRIAEVMDGASRIANELATNCTINH